MRKFVLFLFVLLACMVNGQTPAEKDSVSGNDGEEEVIAVYVTPAQYECLRQNSMRLDYLMTRFLPDELGELLLEGNDRIICLVEWDDFTGIIQRMLILGSDSDEFREAYLQMERELVGNPSVTFVIDDWTEYGENAFEDRCPAAYFWILTSDYSKKRFVKYFINRLLLWK